MASTHGGGLSLPCLYVRRRPPPPLPLCTAAAQGQVEVASSRSSLLPRPHRRPCIPGSTYSGDARPGRGWPLRTVVRSGDHASAPRGARATTLSRAWRGTCPASARALPWP
ncbi:unnamed protein product [Urochloa humidicola]